MLYKQSMMKVQGVCVCTHTHISSMSQISMFTKMQREEPPQLIIQYLVVSPEIIHIQEMLYGLRRLYLGI